MPLSNLAAYRFVLPKGAALLLGICGLSGCLDTAPPVPNKAVPKKDVGPLLISFSKDNLYPEGVEYGTDSKYFYVSSLTSSTIGKVSQGGTYSAFITDTCLVSSYGLQIDASGNRLLVAIADPGHNKARTSAATKNKLAALASFDIYGRRVGYVNLGKLRPGLNHFANDVAIDLSGNTYVTDSFAPIIYKVDKVGVATVLVEDARLGAPAGQVGLNGIVFHSGGYLLVAKTDDGSLFKIPLSNPGSFTQVATTQDLKGIDGLSLDDPTRLYAVSGTQAKVFNLTTSNNWTTALSQGSFATSPEHPTTLARLSLTETYVLSSRLTELQNPPPSPSSLFSLNKVRF
ncbi:hypothetical protein LGH70_07770 [Hymenobacter sp. BT635]|uniref:SMP-30/Gluconolactonase/LRE-like region domain-containing protein n=1 Tax=Hymenobacter nitidus TaxID=2880929 RepID=A0ABS8ABC5_9BACT|nr:hypothetical protein [Hymenobacter nitidus]MCB2377474.1 hypothetical protein [Hymenobacter nitidus]